MTHNCEIKAMLCASSIYCRRCDASGNCTKRKLFGKSDKRPDCFNCVAVKITLSKDENDNTKLSISAEADKTNEALNASIDNLLRSALSGGEQ